MPTHSPDTLLLSHVAAGNLPRILDDLKQGANVNVQHPRRGSPLMMAIQKGHDAVIPALLSAGADPNMEPYNVGSPLHALVWSPTGSMFTTANRLRIVTLMAMHGADLNAWAPNGNTPLISAASQGNLDLVRHLLDLGADPNRCARSPHLKTLPGQPQGPRTGVSPLTHAVSSNNAAMDAIRLGLINVLLHAGANVNALDGHGNLPLYTAVSAQLPVAFVQRLLDAGADPACPGLRDRNTFEETLEQRSTLDVKMLFEKRALQQVVNEAAVGNPPVARVPHRL